MATFRMTYKTRCGKTNTVVETGDYYEEALSKARTHIELKHSPMTLVLAEVKNHDNWKIWSIAESTSKHSC